jgi:ribosomal protein L11 methyltransferase
MLELFPEGFEEAEREDGVEFSAYTAASGERQLRAAFGSVASAPVEADWAERWRDFHVPVRVGALWIGPPWEQRPRGVVPVVIDPGRAFGTGAHATTRLCLELLAQSKRGGLLDLGCGSGVVAVAAAKLGFSPVFALDSDPAAVEATRANARRNGVAIEIRHGDALDEPLPRADVAVANLELDLVEAVAARLHARLLIASGYFESDDPRLPRFERRERRTAEGWVADVFERVA